MSAAAALSSLVSFVASRCAAAAAEVRSAHVLVQHEHERDARDALEPLQTLREAVPRHGSAASRRAWKRSAAWLAAMRRALRACPQDTTGTDDVLIELNDIYVETDERSGVNSMYGVDDEAATTSMSESGEKDASTFGALEAACFEAHDCCRETLARHFYSSPHLVASIASVVLSFAQLAAVAWTEVDTDAAAADANASRHIVMEVVDDFFAGATCAQLVLALSPICGRRSHESSAMRQNRVAQTPGSVALRILLDRVARTDGIGDDDFEAALRLGGRRRERTSSGNDDDAGRVLGFIAALADHHAASDAHSASGEVTCSRICSRMFGIWVRRRRCSDTADATKDTNDDDFLASGIGRVMGTFARRGYATCVAHAIVRAALRVDGIDGDSTARSGGEHGIAACVMAIEHVRARTQVLENMVKLLLEYNVSTVLAVALLDACYAPMALSRARNEDEASTSSMRSLLVDEFPLQRCARLKSRRGLLYIVSFCERYDSLEEDICDAAVMAFSNSLVFASASRAEQTVIAATVLHFLTRRADNCTKILWKDYDDADRNDDDHDDNDGGDDDTTKGTAANTRLHLVFKGIEMRLRSVKPWLRGHAMALGNGVASVLTPGKLLFPSDDDDGLVDAARVELDMHADSRWGKTESTVSETSTASTGNVRPAVGAVENAHELLRALAHSYDDHTASTTTGIEHVHRRGEGEIIERFVNVSIADTTGATNVDMSTLEESKTMALDDDSGSDSDDSLVPYDIDEESDISDVDETVSPNTTDERVLSQNALTDIIEALQMKPESSDYNRRACERALRNVACIIRTQPPELRGAAGSLLRAILFASLPTDRREEIERTERTRFDALVALLVHAPRRTMKELASVLYSGGLDVYRRLLLLGAVAGAAKELAAVVVPGALTAPKKSEGSRDAAVVARTDDGEIAPTVGRTGSTEGPTVVSGDGHGGKTRVWGVRSLQLQKEAASVAQEGASGWKDRSRPNNFGPVAATFMLPLMLKFDEKKHGVQMLEECDVPVLVQLLVTLGECVLCCRGLPHAPTLSARLLELLCARDIYAHADASVRSTAFKTGARALTAISSATLSSAMCSSSADDQLLVGNLDKMRDVAVVAARHDPDEQCRIAAGLYLHMQSEAATDALGAMGIAGDDLQKLAMLSDTCGDGSDRLVML